MTWGSRRGNNPLSNWLAVSLVMAMLADVIVILAVPDRIVVRLQFDHLFFDLPFALAAAACWDRARRSPVEARAWRALAVALVCFLLGSLYSVYLLDGFDPSIADMLWLTFYALSFVGISLVARARLTRVSAITWLDGAIGGVGAGAAVSAFVFSHYPSASSSGWLSTAVNLAYPSADVALIVLMILVGHAIGLRDRLWWLLVSGFAVFLIGDVIFLAQLSTDTWVAGGPLELTWPIGATLMGLAASVSRPLATFVSTVIRHFVPLIFVTVTLSLLLIGQRQRLPAVSVVLSVLAVLLVAVRLAITIRSARSPLPASHETQTDDLTKLPNRRALADALDRALHGDEPSTALLVIDLDRFKEVNDSLGHVAGDRLLRKVATRLAENLPTGAFLARLGGDEFAVVLPGCTSTGASNVAVELLESLRPPFSLAGLRVSVQASVGVAAAPEHGRSDIDLMSAADIAMYQAKRHGAGVAVFRLETGDPSRDRLRLIIDVKAALTAGQFGLYFQPQIDTSARQVVGVEALVRWRHPLQGVIPPDRFLPMITQLGLMADLTRLVATEAISTWQRLHRLGHDLRMAVNVSASDLTDGRLVRTIDALVREFDVPRGGLVIEVTEDAVIVDHDHGVATLATLRDAGVIVSIDDYGTGQASLAYLRDLPLDELKIDRTFLRGVPDDRHNAAIVRSTIELAHALRLPVVAEGVETAEVLEWLTDLGCDRCQGFHIAQPMPIDDLIEWLSRRGDAAVAV